MKRNISLIMVFLFGCATAKMVEYVSFQDAVAKTGSKCHYQLTYQDELDSDVHSYKISYGKQGSKLIKLGYRAKSVGGQLTGSASILWEKCK